MLTTQLSLLITTLLSKTNNSSTKVSKKTTGSKTSKGSSTTKTSKSSDGTDSRSKKSSSSSKKIDPDNLKYSSVLASDVTGNVITFLSKDDLVKIESVKVYESKNSSFDSYKTSTVRNIPKAVEKPKSYPAKTTLYDSLIENDWKYDPSVEKDLKNKEVEMDARRIAKNSKDKKASKKKFTDFIKFDKFSLNLDKMLTSKYNVIEMKLIKTDGKVITAQSKLIERKKKGDYEYSGGSWYSSAWFISLCVILVLIVVFIISRVYASNGAEDTTMTNEHQQ